MSIQILQTDIDSETRKQIAENACRRPKATQFNPEPKLMYCLHESEKVLRMPIGLWEMFYERMPNLDMDYLTGDFDCKKTLFTLRSDPKGYRDQDVVFDFAMEQLQTRGSVFLALPTGFGKTSLGNKLACTFKHKTMILCHMSTVLEQWVSEFREHSTAVVQHVKGSKLDPKADIYVMGVLKASHFPPVMFQDIGTVIYDEAHIDTETALTRTLLRFTPKYLIGLSATPKRPDGVDVLFELYFHPSSFIFRKEVKNFTVFKIETDFVPRAEYTFTRKRPELNWSLLISSLAENEQRSEMIVKILTEKEPERKMMVIVDRNVTANYIYNRLLELGERVARLIDRDPIPDPSSYRILVAGGKKAGVGFNDPELEGLIQEKDCKDNAQYEGRIRQHDNVIYDIVDAHRTLESHWMKREKWYRSRGAHIEVVKRKKAIQETSFRSKKPNVQMFLE